VIISTETGGLGNRIKSWVSSMRLDKDTKVYWKVLPNMPATFSELFSNNCQVDTVPIKANTYKSWRLAVLPEDECILPNHFSTVGAATHPIVRGIGKMLWELKGRQTDRYRYMIYPKGHSKRSTRSDAKHIDLEYERIPAVIRNYYVPFFKQIQVKPEILKQADSWSKKNLDANVIGVQVRTWRDYQRRYRKYYIPSKKRLRTLLDKSKNDARFLVVSDSDEVTPWLSEIYGSNRILQFPRRTKRAESYASVDGITEDLIDLVLLSKTEQIFASYLSTFSEVAWWMGGARAKVSVF
tara:strand:+ start:2228 stop:3115 length:888 start_codon:yes stop_codon:yes gene_type:complete